MLRRGGFGRSGSGWNRVHLRRPIDAGPTFQCRLEDSLKAQFEVLAELLLIGDSGKGLLPYGSETIALRTNVHEQVVIFPA
jgi:hypothetical protein